MKSSFSGQLFYIKSVSRKIRAAAQRVGLQSADAKTQTQPVDDHLPAKPLFTAHEEPQPELFHHGVPT